MDAPVKILVVDDDITSRLLMRAALCKAGFDVRLAVGGADALRQFADDPCDLVMLDVDMPGMNGMDACAALRSSAGGALPIVMVTGMDDVKSVEIAYESGATDFIAKPINWALISHRVHYLLRASRAMTDLGAAHARSSQAEAELLLSQNELISTLNAIPDLLFELGLDGRYYSARTPRQNLLAAPQETLLGKLVSEVLPANAAAICMGALQDANENGSSGGQYFELQLENETKWFELSVSRKAGLYPDGPRFMVLSRDISERKEAENKIARLAAFDGLTSLPNRWSFLSRVDREIKQAQVLGKRLGVLYLDLDGFKSINDTQGHHAGDLVLKEVAHRLCQVIRSHDMVSRAASGTPESQLARLGGDEFTALILDVNDSKDILAAADRIREAIQRPFMVHGRDCRLTASIGIAVYPEDGDHVETLLQHADTAMYHAKARGRDNCQFYSKNLTAQAIQRLDLERDLRLALAQGQFHLVYQPQFDLSCGQIKSVEALIRWSHPERGLVMPVDFIGLVESTGLIVPIGQWVIRTACETAAQWQRAGHALRVAANVSALQLNDPDLVRTVVDALAQTGLAPHLLELEVTESALMEDSAATLTTLRSLRALGVHLALDDFGTGYSSMSYLTRMPLGALKIDRSFVMNLPQDKESLSIVRAIVAMAKSLGLKVTAEGVETLHQAQLLTSIGCDVLQGYYFSKPVPVNDIAALLRKIWVV